jgi:hypothetical protein
MPKTTPFKTCDLTPNSFNSTIIEIYNDMFRISYGF